MDDEPVEPALHKPRSDRRRLPRRHEFKVPLTTIGFLTLLVAVVAVIYLVVR